MSTADLPARAELIRTLDEKYVATELAFASMNASAALIHDGGRLRSADGSIDEAGIRARFERFTWRIPALRQRLVRSPLGLTAPAWVPVDELDLDHHVRFHPGVVADDPSSAELLTGRSLGRMDPDRPLWDVLVLDLDSGRVGFVVRYHHVVGDALYELHLVESMWLAEPQQELPEIDEGMLLALGRAPRSRLGVLAIALRDWWREQPSPAAAWRTYWAKPFGRRLRRWGGRVLRPLRNRRASAQAVPERRSRILRVDLAGAVRGAYRMGGTLNDLTVAVVLQAAFDLDPARTEAAVLVPISRRVSGSDRFRNHIAVVRVAAPRSSSLAELVATVRSQVQRAVDTGDSAITRAGDWVGYATHVAWGRSRRYFGDAVLEDVTSWPAVDPGDDIGCLSCAYGSTLTFAVTTRAATDIDEVMTSITRSLAFDPEVAR